MRASSPSNVDRSVCEPSLNRLDGTAAALERSEKRYRTLFENIPLMYFSLESDGTVLEVNAFGAGELGYERGELLGRSVLEVFHPEDHAAVSAQLEALLARPAQVAHWRFRKVRKDGSVLWVQESARVALSDSGRPIVLVVCEDVTERRRIENELERSRDQLRALGLQLERAGERERRRLAEGLHDQLGQLLATARLSLGGLRETEPDVGRRQSIEEVRSLLEEALEQISSLTFDLSCPILYQLGLAAAVRDLCERLEAASGVRFVFDLEAGAEPRDDDVRIALYRVVSELLHNVVRHARAAKARVRLSREGDELRIELVDDGVGFDARDAGKGPTAAGGYGLFAVRERLRELGGRLDISPATSGGTRVIATAFEAADSTQTDVDS